MAVNEIQQPRYNLLLNTLLRSLESAPAPIIGAELLAVLALEVDRPEWKFLAQSSLCAARAANTPTAGQFAVTSFRNISTRGQPLLTVVTRCLGNITVTGGVIARIPTAPAVLPAATKGMRLDSRFGDGSGARGVGEVTAQDLGVLPPGTTIRNTNAVAGIMIDLLPTVVIVGPGGGIDVMSDSVTKSLDTNWEWYERALLPTEL